MTRQARPRPAERPEAAKQSFYLGYSTDAQGGRQFKTGLKPETLDAGEEQQFGHAANQQNEGRTPRQAEGLPEQQQASGYYPSQEDAGFHPIRTKHGKA